MHLCVTNYCRFLLALFVLHVGLSVTACAQTYAQVGLSASFEGMSESGSDEHGGGYWVMYPEFYVTVGYSQPIDYTVSNGSSTTGSAVLPSIQLLSLSELQGGAPINIAVSGFNITKYTLNFICPAGHRLYVKTGNTEVQTNQIISVQPDPSSPVGVYTIKLVADATTAQPPSVPIPKPVDFTLSRVGNWQNTINYGVVNQPVYGGYWTGYVSAVLNGITLGQAGSDIYVYKSVAGPFTRTLTPGTDYPLKVAHADIESGEVAFPWPDGHHITINGVPQNRITYGYRGATSGFVENNYQLRLVVGPVQPPPPPPPPPQPVSGHVVNVGINFQGNGTGTPSLTASLNALLVSGNTGYSPTVLQPGKAYALTVAGSGITSGEVLFVPPAGFDLWINGVPTTRLAFGSTAFPPVYDVLLLPRGGTFTGPVGTASSLAGGSLGWEVSLGSLHNGNSAGSLMIADHGMGAWNVFTPQTLSYNATSSEVRIHRDNAGAIRQILTNEALIDIYPLDDSSFDIRFYPPVAPNITGYQVPVGSWFVSYRVAKDGSPTKLRITKTTADRSEWTTLERTGTYPNFTWNRADWTLTGATPLVRETRVWTGNGGGYDEVQKLLNADDTVVRETNHSYPRLAWGIAPSQSVLGGNAPDAITHINLYYSDAAQADKYGQPRYTVTTGGGWTGYDYSNAADSSNGRGLGTVKTTFTPFGNSPAADPAGNLPPANQGVVTTYDYGPDTFGDNRRLISSETKVNGVLTANTSIAYVTSTANGQRLLTATRTDRSSATETLVSSTTAYDTANVDAGPNQLAQLTDTFFRDQVHATTSPTGVREAYIRQRGNLSADGLTFTPNASGASSRIGVIRGLSTATTDSTALSSYEGYTLETVHVVPAKSTLSFTYRDAQARVVRTTSAVRTASGWAAIDWTAYTHTVAGQLNSRTTSRGEAESMDYTSLLLTRSTDAAGTVTTYTYDAAGRVKTTTRQGVAATADSAAQADLTTEFTYDAAGQILTQSTYATPTGERLTTTRFYDRVGRPTSEQPSGLGATTYTYNPANRTQTVTTPDLATRTQTSYADGQVSSVTGTGTVSQYFTYGVDPDGRRWSQTNHASATSPRWAKTWTDWLGRTVRTEAPPFTGAVNRFSAQQYSARGLLSRQEASGSHPTLYEYDAFGQPSRSIVDFNGNGVVDLAGPDRITVKETEFVQAAADWWFASRDYSYLDFTSTRTLVGQSATRLTGFTSGLREEAWSEDVEGNRSTVRIAVNPALRQILRTTTAPGLANASIEELRNGLPIRSTAPDGIVVVSGFDALGRANTSTHVRAGTVRTTTTSYKPSTTLPSAVVDPLGVATAAYDYDLLGRPVSVRDAAGRTVRSGYTPRGELSRQWGEATYPVSFDYNAYGERTTLRTYQSDAGNQWAGATWPATPGGVVSTSTWDYAPATGGLSRQIDAQGRAVDFDYYFDGKLMTRTWARTIPGGTARVSATYTYEPKTTQLARVDYNDDTPDLVYSNYTRTGAPRNVTDATGTRTFAYDSAKPWRLATETLPALFGSRTLTPVYQTATSTGTTQRGLHTLATVNGAVWGYQLGTAASPAADLSAYYPMTNTGRLAGVDSQSGGAAAVEFNYTYAPDTRLVAGLTMGSFAQTRTYDLLRDLPTAISSAWGTTTRLSFTTTYNPLRQPTRREQGGSLTVADYGDVLTTDYAYDARQQLTAANTYLGTQPVTPAPAALLPGRDFGYGYDAIGNRTRSTARAAEPALQSDYSVNSLNQYTSRTQSGVAFSGIASAAARVVVDDKLAQRQGKYFWGHASFTGPAASVRPISLAAAIASTTSAPDQAQLDNSRFAFFPGTPEAFTHDLDGNLTADGTWTYTYDAENRLIRQEQKTWTIAPLAPTSKRLDYTYDYQGRRVSKTVRERTSNGWISVKETRFIYQGWNLIAEVAGTKPAGSTLPDAGTLLRSYTWGLDLTGSLTASGGVGALVQLNDHVAGQRYLPAYDGNGNVITLTNAATGATAAQYEYSPYGELLRATGTAAKLNPFRFSTKYTDDETGLVYYGYRFYDPRNGRFINRDPIDIEGGYNLYAFVENKANYGWDYLGLSPEQDVITLDPWGVEDVMPVMPGGSGFSGFDISGYGSGGNGGGGGGGSVGNASFEVPANVGAVLKNALSKPKSNSPKDVNKWLSDRAKMGIPVTPKELEEAIDFEPGSDIAYDYIDGNGARHQTGITVLENFAVNGRTVAPKSTPPTKRLFFELDKDKSTSTYSGAQRVNFKEMNEVLDKQADGSVNSIIISGHSGLSADDGMLSEMYFNVASKPVGDRLAKDPGFLAAKNILRVAAQNAELITISCHQGPGVGNAFVNAGKDKGLKAINFDSKNYVFWNSDKLYATPHKDSMVDQMMSVYLRGPIFDPAK